jgi:hypothetical protein
VEAARGEGSWRRLGKRGRGAAWGRALAARAGWPGHVGARSALVERCEGRERDRVREARSLVAATAGERREEWKGERERDRVREARSLTAATAGERSARLRRERWGDG